MAAFVATGQQTGDGRLLESFFDMADGIIQAAVQGTKFAPVPGQCQGTGLNSPQRIHRLNDIIKREYGGITQQDGTPVQTTLRLDQAGAA